MWRLVLQVAVAEAGQSKKYEVTLDEVSDLRLTRGIGVPWNDAELTEMRVESTLDDAVAVDIVMWAVDSGLSARCASFNVQALP